MIGPAPLATQTVGPSGGGGAPRVIDGAERVLHEAPLTVRRNSAHEIRAQVLGTG